MAHYGEIGSKKVNQFPLPRGASKFQAVKLVVLPKLLKALNLSKMTDQPRADNERNTDRQTR